MIEVSELSDSSVLVLNISGKLTKQDLDELIPMLKNHISQSDDPHLYISMQGFKGWESVAAAWKDLNLDADYIGYFDRIAIVGEKKWQEWGTQLVDAISKEELKYFYTEEADKGW
ncbi:MAG: STAS/SEC14 domain-containing protein [Gracilimonas sp.]|jgi:hypothetical protein|uniref:STAS/SEC14 domain-containing protein n=1 Tax=Gracilimonas TaxID=649462 RepID=UPI000366841E|nr:MULTISPECIES: STAS/SEC14 domain-containing protein [Gracilimonas]MBO6585588.1 STAS/SEC14 domain-containing protein [Gracilimonas sp.]MBO6616585.1 STAS/SEC14 domain-containing protein [Gracilimonas sp.]HCD52065.1 STAS/SEC14 domain-containing protein [Balneolaceae bacterium]|tara:strand:- start:103909 stop:104253 length:345 start_codon:yes stop_codon:yes gene_type:complete